MKERRSSTSNWPGNHAQATAPQVPESWNAVTAALSMAYWSLDDDGLISFAEGGVLSLLGLDPDSLEGRSVIDLYAEAPQFTEGNLRALAGASSYEHVKAGDRTLEVRCRAMVCRYRRCRPKRIARRSGKGLGQARASRFQSG